MNHEQRDKDKERVKRMSDRERTRQARLCGEWVKATEPKPSPGGKEL